MKSFNFRLEESLHFELKSLAQSEGTSMAALCREALTHYVERQKVEFGMPGRRQVRHQAAGWSPTTVEIDPEDGWGPEWCSSPQRTRMHHLTSPAEPESLFKPYGQSFSESALSGDGQLPPSRYDSRQSFDTALRSQQAQQRFPRTLLDELWA